MQDKKRQEGEVAGKGGDVTDIQILRRHSSLLLALKTKECVGSSEQPLENRKETETSVLQFREIKCYQQLE